MSTEIVKVEPGKGGQGTKAIVAFLNERQTSIQEAAGKYFTAETLIKLYATAAMKESKLGQCTPISVLNSLVVAAQVGLDPTGVNGEGYLIPYGQNCTFIPGYRGLCKMARRSPNILHIESRLVYRDDEYEVEYGSTPQIHHKPAFDGARGDGDIVAAYAMAWVVGMEYRPFEVMTIAEIDRVMRKSGGPLWKSEKAMMARKTPIRRLCKVLPLNEESAAQLALATSLEDEDTGREPFDGDKTRQSLKTRMRNRAAGRDAQAEQPEGEEPQTEQDEPIRPEASRLGQRVADRFRESVRDAGGSVDGCLDWMRKNDPDAWERVSGSELEDWHPDAMAAMGRYVKAVKRQPVPSAAEVMHEEIPF